MITRRLTAVLASNSSPLVAFHTSKAAKSKTAVQSFSEIARPLSAAILPELFEAQVVRAPDAIALVSDDQRLSYAELDAAANRLAHHLIGLDVGPESRVSVAVERSIEMIVVLLAILKAGGAYVPLDPQYPIERLRFMLEDSGAKLILATSESALRLNFGDENAAAVPLLLLDDPVVMAAIAARPEKSPVDADRIAPLTPANLAYVMYTSGSTGTPKGVMTTQSNVAALARLPAYAPLGPGQAVLQLAPTAFDAATFEIWGALLNGARLVLAPPGPPDLDRIAQTISQHKVDTLWLTAGLFRQTIETHPHLLAGVYAAPCRRGHLARWRGEAG